MKRLLAFFAAVVLLGAQSLQAQWIQTNRLWINCFAVSGSNLFAGTDGGGVFLSTNNGTSWTAVNTGLTDTRVVSLAVNGSNLFAGTFGDGVFVSANPALRDASWTAVNTGLTNRYVRSLAVSGSNLFAGNYGGVFLSTNPALRDASWTAVNTGLTNTDVLSLAVNGSNLFAGTDGGGVFLSTNNGTSWIAVNTGLTKPSVETSDADREPDSDDPEADYHDREPDVANLYVETFAVNGSNLFVGTNSGVFLSTNNGTSWTAVNTGLPNFIFVYDFAVNGPNLFAGTDDGVFLSTNNGTSWTAVNTGLPNTAVQALIVNGTNLFAGSYGGGGVWRRPLSEMVTGVEDDFSEVPANIIVSSQLIERNRPSDAYKAENMADGNIATAWAEGADGAGIGEWIQFGFDTPKKIKAIKILAGYAKTETGYFNNNRVKEMKVIFSDGEAQTANLTDSKDFQRIVIDRDRPTQCIKLEIRDVYRGRKFDDTCISEIDFEFKE